MSVYCDAGMFCVFNSKDIFKNIPFIPYLIPIYESVDIDNKEDLILAKKLYKEKK